MCNLILRAGGVLAHCLERSRGVVEWLAFADVDEYFHANKTHVDANHGDGENRRHAVDDESDGDEDEVSEWSALNSFSRTFRNMLATPSFKGVTVLRVRSQFWGRSQDHAIPPNAAAGIAVGAQHARNVRRSSALRYDYPWDFCVSKLPGYFPKSKSE